MRIGGDADWIARYLASLPFTFEVLDSDDVRRQLEVLAQQLLRARRARRRAIEFVAWRREMYGVCESYGS